MRSLDLNGDTVDGRLLLGDGWVPVGAKFNFKLEPTESKPGDKYKFYWVRMDEAMRSLLAAAKDNLAKGNNLVNGRS